MNDVNFMKFESLDSVVAVCFSRRIIINSNKNNNINDDGEVVHSSDDIDSEESDEDGSSVSPLQIQVMVNIDRPSLTIFPLHLKTLQSALAVLPTTTTTTTTTTTMTTNRYKRKLMKQFVKAVSHISVHVNVKSLQLLTSLPHSSNDNSTTSHVSLDVSVIRLTTELLPSSHQNHNPLILVESRKYLGYITQTLPPSLHNMFGTQGERRANGDCDDGDGCEPRVAK